MGDYRVGYVDADGEAVAFFLDSAEDCNAGHLMTYMRVGEHDEAAIDWINEQPLAAADLYGPLHEYLSHRYATAPGETPLNLVIDQAAVPR
ncbi:hypothetical protein H7J07_06045 [Mycobacterium koreense]|uniref:Uncharacterized protein n=1 Tax=Mycolicibacillus koreensis TaxID=1069220 RepID=A0A7I7SBT2_9MYCO|nr:hypothetical protein [Mycolicibacillus koreensis]MCV7247788.1 hypothetical protein [Mycolicibacillus koreensis]OSC34696.1 hypothetical protein B8W67_05460 [Mycolicibacillus koreensis]BBY54173.1 hypothetical protein MKOR_14240 [Mycolicibacillus koreensis]